MQNQWQTCCVSELLTTSLRDRKRTETWSAIHNAAAELTLQKGLENVTVEDIAEISNVSRRTFFNYFSTKEDAILGLQAPLIDDDVRAGFTLDAGFLDAVSRLLLTVAQTTFAGDREKSLRFEVLKRYPELTHRRLSYITQVEALVIDLVQERLDTSAQWQADAPEIPTREASRLIVLVASSTMRFAMQNTRSIRSRDAQFEALDNATTLLRQILRKVQ